MRKLAFLLATVLLVGCPRPTAGDDAGPVDAAHVEPPVDASVVDASGEPSDGGGDAEAGPLDGGAADAGALDAGPADAGFVCAMPDIEPPPALEDDAGPPACVLTNIEGATGRFDGTWEGMVFGAFPLVGPFELPARGEMTFEIYCGDDKLLVDGMLEGRAYQHPDAGPDEPGHPFSGRLYGEYDLESGLVTMVVNPATLNVGSFTGTFQVGMSGQRVNDSFEDGEWCGQTISPPGGNGEGTWRADLR